MAEHQQPEAGEPSGQQPYPQPQQVRGAVKSAPPSSNLPPTPPPTPPTGGPPPGPGRPGQPGPGKPGPGKPGTGKPGAEIPPGARRSLGSYLLLVLAAALATSLRLPWTIAAAVLAIAAIVVGIRLLRASRGSPTAVWNPLVIASLAMSGFVLLTSGASIVAWDAQIALQECQDRALTISAKAQCQAEFSDSLLGRFTTGG